MAILTQVPPAQGLGTCLWIGGAGGPRRRCVWACGFGGSEPGCVRCDSTQEPVSCRGGCVGLYGDGGSACAAAFAAGDGADAAGGRGWEVGISGDAHTHIHITDTRGMLIDSHTIVVIR